jgi:hypothetical protein
VAESLTITHVTAPTDELVTLLEALDLALARAVDGEHCRRIPGHRR